MQPYGMNGGEPGQRGLNYLLIASTNEDNAESNINNDYHTVSLGGKNTVAVKPYDRIVIYSPGGGGYGTPSHTADESTTATPVTATAVVSRTSGSVNKHTFDQETA